MIAEEVAESRDAHNMAKTGVFPCLSMFVEIPKLIETTLDIGPAGR